MYDGLNCIGAGYNKAEYDGINFRWVDDKRYLLLYFSSPVRVGKNITEPNAVLLYAPGEMRDYGSCGNFVNSYCTFEVDKALINKFMLKTNTLFYPENWSAINKLLRKVTDENNNTRPVRDYMITGLLLQLLSELSRGQTVHVGARADKEQQRRRRFEEIREEYLSDLANPPDINDIIASEFFSTSQFYRLYKKFFGVSPNEDLLRARMEYAKDLMIKTELSTSEIATMAGFKNSLNLYRCFGKRSEYTVKQWKNRAKKEE
ncbi:MAG: helix-turn-helix transcriptional regulator [Oscillospiraceae bacterium]|nr:helix-turn-helix transcriptional regulator [Oscillospiraceae bacterium]